MGHTLVDASTPSANVLIINPNAEEVVLPCGSRVGNLVPVSAVSVARSELRLANEDDSSTSRLLGIHCQGVAYFLE